MEKIGRRCKEVEKPIAEYISTLAEAFERNVGKFQAQIFAATVLDHVSTRNWIGLKIYLTTMEKKFETVAQLGTILLAVRHRVPLLLYGREALGVAEGLTLQALDLLIGIINLGAVNPAIFMTVGMLLAFHFGFLQQERFWTNQMRNAANWALKQGKLDKFLWWR